MVCEGYMYYNIVVVCYVFKNIKLFGLFWLSEFKGDVKMIIDLLVIIYSFLFVMFYDGDINVN